MQGRDPPELMLGQVDQGKQPRRGSTSLSHACGLSQNLQAQDSPTNRACKLQAPGLKEGGFHPGGEAGLLPLPGTGSQGLRASQAGQTGVSCPPPRKERGKGQEQYLGDE